MHDHGGWLCEGCRVVEVVFMFQRLIYIIFTTRPQVFLYMYVYVYRADLYHVLFAKLLEVYNLVRLIVGCCHTCSYTCI